MIAGATEVSGVTDRELRVSTVRIDITDVPKGSGFFIAPGHVVTCSHVLESLDLSAPNATAQITVSGVDNVPYTVVGVPNDWPEDDLAVLRVVPAERHRCVLLIPGLRSFDQLQTFGYPERHREGVPRPLAAEGTTGDERLQSLGRGQVEPGMSGAPILNMRTGGVCGVVRLTRDEHQDLGGYAIPIEQLALRSPTLMRQNTGYHSAHRDWFDLLPPKQKSAFLAERPTTPGTDGFSSLFVVSVGREGNDWEVSAAIHPAGALPSEPLPSEEVNLNLVRDKVARLFRDWASRGRAHPGEVAPGRFDPGEDVRLLGSILFSAVLPGAIGERFESMLPTGDERVQLALYFKPGIRREVVEMPWEHLFLARAGVMTDVHLARAEKLAFVRVLSPEPREPEQPHRQQLSALMVGVSPPPDGDGSPLEAVLEQAGNVASRLEGFTLEPVTMPTSAELQRKVEAGSYDIVHYVGFGQYSAGADQLALGRAGGYEYRNAELFARLLAGRRPRLVVLQQIEGPKDVVPADLAALAWELLMTLGVEAVVGYQFPLPGRLSIEFNRALYEQLAAGEAFEMAVQKARAELWTKEPDLHAFLSPAAFVARPGELRLTAIGAGSAPFTRVGVTAAHA